MSYITFDLDFPGDTPIIGAIPFYTYIEGDMQWIKASKTWRGNTRFVDLESAMGWSEYEAIGRWLYFLWWVSEHREDGILRDVTPQQVARAFDADLKDGDKLVEILLKAGFLDRTENELRVTHWLDLGWAYLYQKYHSRQREKLERIAALHKQNISQLEAKRPKGHPWDVPVSISPSQSLSKSGDKKQLLRVSGKKGIGSNGAPDL